MFRKLLVFIFSFFIVFSLAFGAGDKTYDPNVYTKDKGEQKKISDAKLTESEMNKLTNDFGMSKEEINAKLKDNKVGGVTEAALKIIEGREQNQAGGASCSGENCLTDTGFMVDLGGLGLGGPRSDKAKDTVNIVISTAIQKFMIALGGLSLLIMTIGAGYMVLYHGQDEFLSKGKSIFMSGIIALIIALSSYLIIDLIKYILYQ